MSDTFDTIKVEPERDRYGRYLIHPANGGKPKAHTRATTIAETLDDRYNLEAWKQRMVALGLAQRPDLYASVASLQPDEKTSLNRLCDQAREAAAGSAGANLGTALHRFTERVNRGEDVKVPAPWDADIAAYGATMSAHQLVIDARYLERIVVLDKLGVAGMFDMMVMHKPRSYRIADLKTGQVLDFSWCAIAVQLAIYAHADTIYDTAAKTHEPMPAVDQDKALVIHLPAGKATCTLYEVDIAAGWEAAQHALWTRNWRKRKNLAVPATQIGGGEPAPTTPQVEPAPPAVTPKKRRTFGDELRARTPAAPVGVEEAADPVAVIALERRYGKLSSVAKAWVDYVAAQSHEAGYTLNTPTRTVRQFEITRALVRFATLDPDDRLLRGAIEITINEETKPMFHVGAYVASLTIPQAIALNDIALAIHEGKRSVVYSDDTAQLPAA